MSTAKDKYAGRRLLSTKEASEYMDNIVTRRTLERWRASKIKKGPPWVDVEGKIGYRPRDLDHYLEEKLQHPESDDFEP